MTPQRRTRQDEQDQPSRTPSRMHGRDKQAIVGGGGARSRLLSPRVAGDRQPSDPSRRTQPRGPPTRGFCCKEPMSQNMEGDTCEKKKTGPWIGASQRDTKPHNLPQSSAKDTQARSTIAQRHERQLPGSEEGHETRFEMWPDIPHTWERGCDARGHSELSRTFQVARFLDRLPANCWNGRPIGSGGKVERGGGRGRGTQTSLPFSESAFPYRVAPSRARAPVLGVESERSWTHLPHRKDFCDRGQFAPVQPSLSHNWDSCNLSLPRRPSTQHCCCEVRACDSGRKFDVLSLRNGHLR